MGTDVESSESTAAPVIEMREVKKRLGGKQVLDGVNLAVPGGSTTTILGMSGCGKSTLVKHIVGLLRPDSGQVFVEGRDVGGATDAELRDIRKSFGMVFQGSALLQSLTVFENVALPLSEHRAMPPARIRERVAEVLDLVRLTGFEGYLPAELSGGMRKRAGVARAVVTKPDILLYDEPTTGLDPVITNTVNEMIRDMREKLGVTSVVISHDIPSAARTSDRLAVLHNGRILQSGPPEEIMKSDLPEVRQFMEGETRGPLTDD